MKLRLLVQSYYKIQTAVCIVCAACAPLFGKRKTMLNEKTCKYTFDLSNFIG